MRFYDEPYVTHAVYYALQKGLVQLDDSESKFRFLELDHEAIIKMRDENCMQMCTIKLFIVPMGWKRFAVYFEDTGEFRSIQGTEAGGCAISVLRGRNEWGIQNDIDHFSAYINHLLEDIHLVVAHIDYFPTLMVHFLCYFVISPITHLFFSF